MPETVQTPVLWSVYSQQQVSPDMGNYGMTMRLKFEKEWRSYRAATSYDVPKPLADILVSRGFAVVAPKPKPKAKKARKRKTPTDGTDKNP